MNLDRKTPMGPKGRARRGSVARGRGSAVHGEPREIIVPSPIPPKLREAGWTKRLLRKYIREFLPSGARVALSPWGRKAYKTARFRTYPTLAFTHLLAKRMIAVAADYRPWNLQFDVDRNIDLFLPAMTALEFSWMAELGTDEESGHVYIPFVQSGKRQARWLGPYCLRLIRNQGLESCGKSTADLVRTNSGNCLRVPLTLGRKVLFSTGESLGLDNHADQVRAMRIYLTLKRCSYEQIRDRSLQHASRAPSTERGRTEPVDSSSGVPPQPDRSTPTAAPASGRPVRVFLSVSETTARVREGHGPRDPVAIVNQLAAMFPDTRSRRFELQPRALGWLLRQGLGPDVAAEIALAWLRATGSRDVHTRADEVREDLVRFARKMSKDTRRGHGGGTRNAAQVAAGRKGRR